jgi:hypothetical protein
MANGGFAAAVTVAGLQIDTERPAGLFGAKPEPRCCSDMRQQHRG